MFVTITLLSKELMSDDIIKGETCNFIEKKLLKLVPINILFKKKKKLGATIAPLVPWFSEPDRTGRSNRENRKPGWKPVF